LAVNPTFLCILALAAVLRMGTFFYPHNSWDEIYYSSLAMKLDTSGFKEYNLKNVVFNKLPGAQGVEIKKVYNSDNDLISKQKRRGLYYYDEPLFYEPPLLPYLIKFSHDLFARGQKHLYIDLNAWVYAHKNHLPAFFKQEFYKTIVPFTFSLLSICMVFWFCSKFINETTAFYAALFQAVNPVDIMAANRIWTDCIAAFFFTSTLFLFYIAYKKDSLSIILLSGICCSLALLTRIFSVSLLPIAALFRIYLFATSPKKAIYEIADKKTILFLATVFLITLPWFWTTTHVFGSPLHLPYSKNLEKLFPFVYFILHRPWFIYPVNILSQNPIWALFIFAPFCALNKQIKFLLGLWILVPLLLLTILPVLSQVPKEDRFALPVYPAITIAAGFVLAELDKKLRVENTLLKLLLNFLTLVSLFWSLKIAIYFTYSHLSDTIAFPF